MQRRWFFVIGAVLFALGLWVVKARPAELLPNAGGLNLAGDFLGAALRPAFDYEDADLRGGEVTFAVKSAKSLWLTLRYAVAAMSLALVLGVLGGVLGSRAWWSRPTLLLQTLRIGVRLLATAVRSVHELMWALLFLSAVGTSPLAAVLALALPFAGTLAKVFSELLDEGESSAAEVVRLSGGRGLAAFVAGVVTQALPDLATYALYRFECAIRSSAVLGFVGVPTLGYEIKTAFEDGHYREIWTYLYLLLVAVILVEWWGNQVRWRLSRGVPAKATSSGQVDLRERWRKRGVSVFLRSTMILVVLGIAASWMAEDRWGAGVNLAQRERNLERFAADIVPDPVRKAGGDWSGFRPWLQEKMDSQGWEALWQTFHLGTVAVLLAGGIALGGALLAARSLASSNPRGVTLPRSWWRPLLAGILRGGAILGRAMPEFILAFLLLRIFGPTVWALILALAIHNGGILLRLAAEIFDNTNSTASGVILAQGGSRASSFLTTLLPVSFNRLVLFLFYRWESCIREATILGMLGVASLGLLISDAKVSFYYDEMMLWVALGAGLVFVGDVTSDLVRARLRGKVN